MLGYCLVFKLLLISLSHVVAWTTPHPPLPIVAHKEQLQDAEAISINLWHEYIADDVLQFTPVVMQWCFAWGCSEVVVCFVDCVLYKVAVRFFLNGHLNRSSWMDKFSWCFQFGCMENWGFIWEIWKIRSSFVFCVRQCLSGWWLVIILDIESYCNLI